MQPSVIRHRQWQGIISAERTAIGYQNRSSGKCSTAGRATFFSGSRPRLASASPDHPRLSFRPHPTPHRPASGLTRPPTAQLPASLDHPRPSFRSHPTTHGPASGHTRPPTAKLPALVTNPIAVIDPSPKYMSSAQFNVLLLATFLHHISKFPSRSLTPLTHQNSCLSQWLTCLTSGLTNKRS